MENDAQFWFTGGALIGGLVAGLMLGALLEGAAIRKQAIERGYAIHDPQTGEWRWVDAQPQTGDTP